MPRATPKATPKATPEAPAAVTPVRPVARPAGVPAARPAARLYPAVHASLLEELQAGRWPVGARLPTERELQIRFDVSRPVIRTALALLCEAGWISRRQGSGSVVLARRLPGRASRTTPVDAKPTLPSLRDAFEFRLTIECDSARLAATRRSRLQLQAIERALVLMQDPIAERERGDADLSFHLAIAEATGNPHYAATLRVVQAQILAGMRESGAFGLRFESRASDIQRQHRAILTAIRARDPQAAAEAMHAHLRASRFRVLGFEPSGGFE